ncbi:MAG: PAS domain S-box protein [Betaproteobacteria bacterium]|nr:PAS domain S-box protein [Betaproteobacteria bacterium]
MSLHFRINLLITVLTVLFTAAVLNIVVEDTRRSIREEMEGANRVTLQLLSTVIRDAQVVSREEGDMQDVLLSFLRELGRVRAHEIKLFDTDGAEVYTSPPSVYKVGRSAPDWFVRLVRPRLPVVNLPAHGANVTVTVDASRAVLDAWDDLKTLVAVVAAFLVAVNVLVFFLIGRSLRPVESILAGLQRMEQGDLSARLPRLATPEFEAISHTFNGMAEKLERSLAENRRLALIAQQSSDAIIILDLEGRVSYWNPAAERLFGFTADEIVGQPSRLLVPHDLLAELADHSTALRRRGTIDHLETRRRTRDGRQIDVALAAAPLIDPSADEVIGEIYSIRDVTELKRAREAEAELEQNRRLTRLIQSSLEEERRTIARELHDELGQCATAVRTIGTVIARKTESTQPDIHEGARMIVDTAGRIYDALHGIIRQLRPSALDHLGLKEALEEAVMQWRTLHPEVAFVLEVHGDTNGLGETVNITVYRIVQECLNNIVKHARATRAEVRVDRTSRPGHDELRVSVRDDGRGLSEPDAQRATRFGLLGMRERAEALGGTFELRSGEGEGLAVSVSLPLDAALTPDAPEKIPGK